MCDTAKVGTVEVQARDRLKTRDAPRDGLPAGFQVDTDAKVG